MNRDELRADHFLPYKIYLVECADLVKFDGEFLPVVRQRCGRHVEITGPLRVVRKLRSHDPDQRWTCIMCGVAFTDDERRSDRGEQRD